MKRYTLQAQYQADMDCPKEVVMWNYYDHEHLVGTHYKLYDRARVVAERDDWALVYRSKRMPLLPFRTSNWLSIHGWEHHEEFPQGFHRLLPGNGN
jgi:hypothetical protein